MTKDTLYIKYPGASQGTYCSGFNGPVELRGGNTKCKQRTF